MNSRNLGWSGRSGRGLPVRRGWGCKGGGGDGGGGAAEYGTDGAALPLGEDLPQPERESPPPPPPQAAAGFLFGALDGRVCRVWVRRAAGSGSFVWLVADCMARCSALLCKQMWMPH